MTKSEIKAELRRSACQDKNPLYACSWESFCCVTDFEKQGQFVEQLSKTQLRIFFLLVAEAL